jgi:hypothetical protein
MSIAQFENELPYALRWNPGVIYDPIPEWWLREHEQLVAEVVAIRLETAQAVLEVQAAGFAKAAELARQRLAGE